MPNISTEEVPSFCLALDSLGGTCVFTCATVDTLVRNFVMVGTLGNSVYGTFALTRATADTCVGNFVCHFSSFHKIISVA